jgi:hypothetical protein
MKQKRTFNNQPITVLALLLPAVVSGSPPPTATLRCTPSVISPGKTLTLKLSMPHGRELGVWTPHDRFLFIAYDLDEQDNPVQPPIPAGDFVQRHSLEVSTLSAKGVDLIKQSSPELIFNEPGTYRFIVSDNLETDDDAHQNLLCDVRYKIPK